MLLAAPISAYIFVRTPSVQTFIARITASYLSQELNTTILIEKIRINELLSLVVEDFYAEDMEGNTMLSIHEFSLGIKRVSLKNKILHVNQILIDSLEFNVATYIHEEYPNISLMVNHFMKSDSSSSGGQNDWFILCDDFKLSNSSFLHLNEHRLKPAKSMDYANLRITEINIDIEDFSFRDDTISAFINTLIAMRSVVLTCAFFRGKRRLVLQGLL